MQAKSKKQRNFFKIVLAYKKGEMKKDDVNKDVIDVANKLSLNDIENFANTNDSDLTYETDNVTTDNVIGMGNIIMPENPQSLEDFTDSETGSGDNFVNILSIEDFLKTLKSKKNK